MEIKVSESNDESTYTDDSFWKKIKNYAKSAGKSVLESALKIYYVAQDKDTPIWAKTTIYAALGYFISPIDAIPDITPVIGYTDDLGVLVTALAAVSIYIKKKHSKKANKTLKQWFG